MTHDARKPQKKKPAKENKCEKCGRKIGSFSSDPDLAIFSGQCMCDQASHMDGTYDDEE